MPYIIAPAALYEIDEIVDRIKEDNPFAAERWLSTLIENFAFLADFPHTGRERPAFGDGVYVFPYGKYLMLYEIAPDHVVIVHVIHGARDIERALRP